MPSWRPLRLAEYPNLVWLRLSSDEGAVGLGETSFAAESVEAYLHEFVAPRMLGRNPLEIERLNRELTGYLGFRGSGVETRAVSAVDIALWDLYGKVCGQPPYQVLGGASRVRSGPPTPARATGTSVTRGSKPAPTGASAPRQARTKISKPFCTVPTSLRSRFSSPASRR